MLVPSSLATWLRCAAVVELHRRRAWELTSIGLLHDKTRPPGIAPLASELVNKVVALTLEPPDHEAIHWRVVTARA